MPPLLLSERLELRPPRNEDLEDIYRLGKNPRVMRYITNGRTQNRAQARADLQRRIEQSGRLLGYWIAQRRTDQTFLGWVALKPLDESDKIEVGYRLLEEHWGRGYATEAARMLIDYGFNQLRLNEIWAVAREENKASIRVMEKLGLQYHGTGRYYDTDCVRYRITFVEYQLQSPGRRTTFPD